MASNYHSRILRESLRDRDGSHSIVSSTGSRHGTISPDTISEMSFNPDQDDPYSESTRIFETPNLPKLRDTARKYKYPAARTQSPEMIIDTSALRKSFPNFSQSPRDRIDMEKIARLAAQSRNVDPTPTRFGKAENTNQQKSSTTTTKEPVRQISTQQKENITPSYVSGATRSRNGEVRRTLAELNPKVRDESDHSFVSDRLEKSSRFSSTDYTQQSQNTTGTQQSKVHPAVKTTRNVSQKTTKPAVPHKATPYYKSQPAKVQENTTIASSNLYNPTQQSFIIPKNVPEISDLVTATFKDGSPVYVQNGAVQSRFANSGKPLPQKHGIIDGIEVPQDEQDIFISLEQMQERITQLEGDKSDAQRIANDLDKDNYKLREELKQASAGRRRSDSAIVSDTGADAEKSKLQDEINRLKAESEASKRKIQTLELHLTNNTTERDRAINRVAEFNKTCENLRSDNLGLRNEIDGLRQQGEHVASQREASQQELQHNEASWRDLRTELEHRIALHEDRANGFERFIADIQKSYKKLELREKSSNEEIETLKHQLQISKSLYGNSLKKCHQCAQKEQSFAQQEDAWKAKVYRLEKALRKVLSLKFQKDVILNSLNNGVSVQTSTQKTSPSVDDTPKASNDDNLGDAFDESSFSDIEIQDTVKTQHTQMTSQNKSNVTTTQELVSPEEEKTSSKKTAKSTGTSSEKTVPPFTVNSAVKVSSASSKKTVPPFAVNSAVKVSNATVGPKTALTNAAIHAYGYGDFPFEFPHDDDLTQSTNFDSIIGSGVMQELRDDVVNAGKIQTTAPTPGNAELTTKSQHTYSDVESDIFNSNVKGKNSTALNKNTTEQELNERRRSDSQFDLKIQNNPFPKFQSYGNDAETPLENIHQRYQQRRRSEGSVDVTGINADANHTVNSMSERSTVVRKRSQSQTSQVSGANNTGRVSNHRRSNSDNMTSAYIIPDIDVTNSNSNRQESQRFSSAPVCGHGFPYQGPDQCDTCARTASSIVDAQDSCKNLILIPVSERMPAPAVNGGDEPTIRPSMPPMNALGKVLRDLILEEKAIKKELYSLEYDLNAHDSSLGRSKRKTIAAEVARLLENSQKKADQIYFLYDVLEGLKETEEWNGIED